MSDYSDDDSSVEIERTAYKDRRKVQKSKADKILDAFEDLDDVPDDPEEEKLERIGNALSELRMQYPKMIDRMSQETPDLFTDLNIHELTVSLIDAEDTYVLLEKIVDDIINWRVYLQQEFNEVNIIDNNYIVFASTQNPVEGQSCPKCKKKTVVETEEVRRSGDEAETIILTCHNPNCGYRKRF